MNFNINYFLEKALNWNQKNNIEKSQDDLNELKIKLIGLNIIKYLIQNTDEQSCSEVLKSLGFLNSSTEFNVIDHIFNNII